ncbi:MAG: hypothetical protein ACK559_18105, partial [bacterium]
IFTSVDEIKNNYENILQYLDKIYDKLDPIQEDQKMTVKQLRERYTEPIMRYRGCSPRTGDIEYKTTFFDDMFWQQQYYNAVMRSAMNHHFKEMHQ